MRTAAESHPFTRTRTLVPLGALLLGGCTAPRPASLTPPPPTLAAQTVETCVVSGGRLAKVQVEVSGATGDTTFQGRPFRAAFPLTPEYAAGADWYESNEPIPEDVWPQENARGDYVKYGGPRELPADTLVLLSSHHGVGVYAALDDPRAKYGILYVPVRPGCWFQNYQFTGVGELREG